MQQHPALWASTFKCISNPLKAGDALTPPYRCSPATLALEHEQEVASIEVDAYLLAQPRSLVEALADYVSRPGLGMGEVLIRMDRARRLTGLRVIQGGKRD